MDIHLLSKDYTVRRLDENDMDRIYALSCGNKTYYKYHPPFVTRESILADLNALPPGKSREDKYYVGFFQGQDLVALMDLILAYPTEDSAWIGLFMVHAQYQHKGTGSRIMGGVRACLQQSGYARIRLGVDIGNPQSYAFWTKNRFLVTGINTYILMESAL